MIFVAQILGLQKWYFRILSILEQPCENFNEGVMEAQSQKEAGV